MIVRLSPEQITSIWEVIRPEIYKALVPTAEATAETLQYILQGLLMDNMQCWLGLEDSTPPFNDKIYAVMITTIYTDLISRTKSLLIYTLTTVKEVPPAMWSVGMKGLEKFASAQDCKFIISYSDNPEMVAIANALKFRKMNFLIKEV